MIDKICLFYYNDRLNNGYGRSHEDLSVLKELSRKYFLVLEAGKISMTANRPEKNFKILSLKEIQKMVIGKSQESVYALVWQRFNYFQTEVEGSGSFVFTGVIYNKFSVFEICSGKKGNGFASFYQAMDILGLDENLKVDIEN